MWIDAELGLGHSRESDISTGPGGTQAGGVINFTVIAITDAWRKRWQGDNLEVTIPALSSLVRVPRNPPLYPKPPLIPSS